MSLLLLLEVLSRVKVDSGDELLVLVGLAPRCAEVADAHQVGLAAVVDVYGEPGKSMLSRGASRAQFMSSTQNMKKIETIKSVIIGVLLAGVIFLFTNPRIQEVEKIKEIEVLQTVIDSIYVDKIIEKKVFVPKYITKEVIVEKPVEVIKEVIVKEPVDVIQTVYVDKPYETIVEVLAPPQKKLFLGFGYQYDLDNFFSGSNVKLLYKAPGDKMFGIDVGFRNDLLDRETMTSKLRPYIGGSIYFRLDKDKL